MRAGNAMETHEHKASSRVVNRLVMLPPFTAHFASMKTMKEFIWLLPLRIVLGAMFVAVEIKGSSPSHEILINYGNLSDTSGRHHSVLLVLHPDGSVTWRDVTRHIR